MMYLSCITSLASPRQPFHFQPESSGQQLQKLSPLELVSPMGTLKLAK